MKLAYFDCFSGASGDMILGALVSVGWPAADLEATLSLLGAKDYRVNVVQIVKQGIPATQVSFELPPQPAARRFGELIDMVVTSGLSERLKHNALRVLRRLGEAEAAAHGAASPIEDLHLHELGSLDTLFDVVGSVAGLDALNISSVHVSPINLGGGFVNTAHGRLPVPAPAVAELAKGISVYGGTQRDGELLTPTGAALLGTLGHCFGPMPTMSVQRVGAGAGMKEGYQPNVLRMWVGDGSQPDHSDQIQLLEANIDDMNPEFYSPIVERLLAAGALDVFLTPIIMKKGRPSVVLGVICVPEQSATLEDIIFDETTTLGIRSGLLTRRKLDRDVKPVNTPYGNVRVKIGSRRSKVITVAPEFEDCRLIAVARQVPIRVVYEAAQLGFHQQYPIGE